MYTTVKQLYGHGYSHAYHENASASWWLVIKYIYTSATNQLCTGASETCLAACLFSAMLYF